MTWKEICEKAKEMGATIDSDGTIYFGGLEFKEDGHIYKFDSLLDEYIFISSNRTTDQIYAIMEALQWKESPNETSNSN